MPDISIIIRTLNEEMHIGRLLSGVLQQSLQPAEIILVDSGSSDATTAIASRFPVRILNIDPADFSFGRSLNMGCRFASGEFLVIISGHCYPVYKDWLEKMVAPFENPRVGLVYGKQRGNETTKYSEKQIFSTWFPDSGSGIQSNPFCNNANAVVRKSIWENIAYNENLTGLEDLDWAKRMQELEYSIYYSNEAEVIHVHDETYKSIENRYRREALALKQIFPREHFHFWDFLRLFTTNVLSDYYHALRDRVLLRNLFSIVAFRFVQFFGTYRGFSRVAGVDAQLRKTFYYPRALKRSGGPESGAGREVVDYSHGAREETRA